MKHKRLKPNLELAQRLLRAIASKDAEAIAEAREALELEKERN